MADDFWDMMKSRLTLFNKTKKRTPFTTGEGAKFSREPSRVTMKVRAYDNVKVPIDTGRVTSKGTVSGVIVRVQINGFGVVKLDNGGEAYFDRFGVSGRSVKLRGKLHAGTRVVGEAEPVDDGIAKLHAVAHA